MFRRILAVARRVLRQLRGDRRFLGMSLVAPLLIIALLKVFFDAVESPLFEPARFIVPLGAFLLHFLTYLLCAIVLVRERTSHTLARMFISGFRRIEIISGYVLAYTVLGTLQSALVLVELSLLFDLAYGVGTWLALFLVIWLLAIISIALGIFVSNFARNEGQVFPFVPLIIVPSIFLSGIIVAVDKLPAWAQTLSYAVPLFYATESITRIIAPGGSLGSAAGWLLALPAFGLVVLGLATLTLRETE